MIAITLSHVPNIAEGSTFAHFFRSFNYCFGGFGDNLFVIVGCWFLVESKAKFDRVLRLIFQVCLYSICLSIVSKLMGSNVTVRGFLASFSYWFPFGYAFMLILFPFIKRVKVSTQKVIMWTVGGVCLAVTIAKMLGYNNIFLRLFSKGLFIGPLWFCTVFAFINCYKNKLKLFYEQQKSILLILASICIHLVMTVVVCRWNLVSIRAVCSPLCFFCALAMFGFFYKLRIDNSAIINTLSSVTFGVYLIQCHRIFRAYVWKKVFDFEALSISNLGLYILFTILIIIGLFTLSYIIDFIWKAVFSFEAYPFRMGELKLLCPEDLQQAHRSEELS